MLVLAFVIMAGDAASQPVDKAPVTAKAAASQPAEVEDTETAEAESDEPVNDEAAELDALKELDADTGHAHEAAAQTPSFPEDDLDLAKRAGPAAAPRPSRRSRGRNRQRPGRPLWAPIVHRHF